MPKVTAVSEDSRPSSQEGGLLTLLVRSVAMFGAAAALDVVGKAGARFGGYLVAFLFAVVSAGFLTLAGYRAISQALNGIYAALIVGVVFLVLALVALVIVQRRRR